MEPQGLRSCSSDLDYSKQIHLSDEDISAIIAYMIVSTVIKIASAKNINPINLKEIVSVEEAKLKYIIDIVA